MKKILKLSKILLTINNCTWYNIDEKYKVANCVCFVQENNV